MAKASDCGSEDKSSILYVTPKQLEKPMKTKIMTCNCKHEYQDERYGKNKRVFNAGSVGTGTKITYKCTVCEAKITK